MQRKIVTIAAGLLLVIGGIGTIILSREYFARLILGAASRATLQHAQKHIHTSAVLHRTVSAWLVDALQDGILTAPVHLQSASVIEAGQVAVLSFDRPLLDEGWATQQKWSSIESLLAALSSVNMPLNAVTLLCNHEPMHDEHLDFAAPWPIDGYRD